MSPPLRLRPLRAMNSTREDAVIPSMQHTKDNESAQVVESTSWIKLAMKELIDHSRSQTTAMATMQIKMDAMANKLNSLEARNTFLEAEYSNRLDVVDERQIYHEMMLRNQHWKYRVGNPRSNYWNTIRNDKEHIRCAEFFLEQIKAETTKMRHGEGNGDVSLITGHLPYNRAFYLHWEEFANALREHRYKLKCLPEGYDTAIQLCDVHLPNIVLDILAKALRSTHFKTLQLTDNNFGQYGISFALDYVENNPILEEFSLNQNSIENTEDVVRLCRIVKEHPSVNQLRLHGCFGEDINSFKILCSIINAGWDKLKYLCFSSNGVSTEGSTLLSDFVASNPPMEYFSLVGNQLNDRDACMLAKALKHNKNMRFISLQSNLLTSVGWVAFRNTKLDLTSLNSAADSNHTCDIVYDDRSDRFSETNSTQNNPGAERAKKVYSVLSKRNKAIANVQHFAEVPVEFLPDILSSIRDYSEYHLQEGDVPKKDDSDVESVSIVYEILRRWDKALTMFESLSDCKTR